MQEILREHILPHIASFIGALLTGFAGFIFGRKKQNAEVESIEAGNASTNDCQNHWANQIAVVLNQTIN